MNFIARMKLEIENCECQTKGEFQGTNQNFQIAMIFEYSWPE